MTPTDNSTSLAGDFPAAGRDQWVRLAARALVRDLSPDDDPERVVNRLRSTTYDGIVIEPLYTADAATTAGDETAVDPTGLPGFSPFVRGRTAGGGRAHGWDVRQIVDGGAVGPEARAELERGSTSLWLDVRSVDRIDADTLAAVLDGVYLDLTSVTLAAGPRFAVAAESMIDLWARQGIAGSDARGGFGADPFGSFASSGGVLNIDADLDAVAELAARLVESHPHVRIVTVDATRFHEAGASDGQELGLGLAVAVATLRSLEAAGGDLEAAFGQIELRFAATADQFSTIAKFRAARRLWSRVADVVGVGNAAARTPIHAVTSAAMMTLYDPWVNLLRGTIACFGAGVGGADAITVLPFDIVADPAGSELGRRIARNTQSILSKESNLARVVDPSGGSWYVESLTEQLAEAAWARFRQIEARGGLVAAVESGFVADQIEVVWQQRRANIVTRKDPLTGVSEFPDVLEPAPPSSVERSLSIDEHSPQAGSPYALGRHRYASPFEDLRQRVDRVAAGVRGRPTVFLANIAAPSVHTARATFAKNLFEIAGLLTVSGPGSTDPAELADQFAASGAAVACICSSDRIYADLAVDVAVALRGREDGDAVIYVAGRPKDIFDQLVAAGVDGFITAGADVEQILSDLLHRLDVP